MLTMTLIDRDRTVMSIAKRKDVIDSSSPKGEGPGPWAGSILTERPHEVDLDAVPLVAAQLLASGAQVSAAESSVPFVADVDSPVHIQSPHPALLLLSEEGKAAAVVAQTQASAVSAQLLAESSPHESDSAALVEQLHGAGHTTEFLFGVTSCSDSPSSGNEVETPSKSPPVRSGHQISKASSFGRFLISSLLTRFKSTRHPTGHENLSLLPLLQHCTF